MMQRIAVRAIPALPARLAPSFWKTGRNRNPEGRENKID